MRPSIVRLHVALAVALAGAAPARAEPADPRPIRLAIDTACEDLDVTEVRRIVAVELRPRVRTQPDEARGDEWATAVSAACVGEALSLRVDDRLSGKHLSREIDLAQTPRDARARLVALAISELVLASWAELVVNPEPVVPPAGPRPPAERRDEARRAASERAEAVETRLWVEPSVHLFPQAVLWGGGVRWSAQHRSGVGVEVDLRYDRGGHETPVGRAVADRASAALAPHLHFSRDSLRWRLSAGLRAGVVRMSGEAGAPGVRTSSGSAPWAGPLVGAGLELRAGFITFEVTAEGGFTLAAVSAQVDAQDVLALRGPWLALTIGLGFAP